MDRATRPYQLKVKEIITLLRTQANTRLNQDGDYDLPGCWITTMKKLGEGPTAPGLITVAVSAHVCVASHIFAMLSAYMLHEWAW